MKGALWSGLILPGLGQIVLKHYKRGAVLIVTVLASLSIVIADVVQQALAILEKIEAEGGAVSAEAISNMATRASTATDNFTVNFFFLLAVLCWLFGIVDAYSIGKKQDNEAQKSQT